MVAVVSGTGLGLGTSSLSSLGFVGSAGTTPGGSNGERIYVNSATGNLVLQSRDEFLAAAGLDVALVRTYNSQGQLTDDNGDNWRLGVHQRLFGLRGTVNTTDSTIVKVFGDGAEVVYRHDGTIYTSTDGDGAHDTLSYNATTQQWTWTDGSGRTTETYDVNGRLIAAADTDGNAVTYTYTGTLLTRVDDASGQTTFLDYTGNNLTQVRVVSQSVTQTITRYTYDGQNRLSTVTVDLSPADNSITDDGFCRTTYTYDGTSTRIATIAQSRGTSAAHTSVAFTYESLNGQYRLRTFTDGENRVTTFAYSESSPVPVTVPANPAVLSTTDQQQVTNNYNLNTGALTTPPGGTWASAGTLESSSNAAANPRVAFDASGNGVAVWVQQGVLHTSRYTLSINAWSSPTSLNTVFLDSVAFAADADGNVIVGWGESDMFGAHVYARRYYAATSSWGGVELVQTYGSGGGGGGSSIGPGAMKAGVSAPAKNDLIAPMEGESPTIQSVQVALRAGVPVVSWTWGTSGFGLGAARISSGAWLAAEVAAFFFVSVTAAAAAIDAQGNIQLAYIYSDNMLVVRFDATAGTWDSGTLLESSATAAIRPRISLDANGNGFAVWQQGNDLFARRYVRSTNTWAAAVTIDSGSAAISSPTLAVDGAGNAVVAWVQSDGTAASILANRYDASAGTWGTATLLETSSNAVDTSDGSVVADIAGNRIGVAWLQTDGTRNNVHAARFDGTSWSTSTTVESNNNAASAPSIAVDSQGNVTAVWQQSDGTAQSVYQARFTAGGGAPYYLVPSGATWQSVANTLYGVNSAAAGTALQTALGNPALTTGAQLTNLPAVLSVTTTETVTVPAYYTVPSGATWDSVTQAIYGTSEANAVTALQTALGNPTLTTGLKLTVPLNLTYASQNIYLRLDAASPLGFVTSFTHDAAGRLTSILSPTVGGSRLETRYTYDAAGNVTQVIEDPNGLNRITAHEYDAQGNLTLSRDASGSTIARTYSAPNQLLTETRYLTPDPDGNGSGQPAQPLTTRYVYDSEQHLRFLVSSDGRVAENRYNAAGRLVTTLTYTDGVYDVSALAPATALTESQLTTWVAARNLERLERVDFAYDFRGNVTTATTYARTDSSGAGLAAGSSLTRFTYDQRGRLVSSIDPRGEATGDPADFVTTHSYDGLGRLLVSTQWTPTGVINTAVNVYDDVNRRATLTLANGLVTTTVFDRAGRLLSVAYADSSQALGTTAYAYDIDGRLRMATDPTGVRSHTLYDDAGRMSFTVDGDGSLTEFLYDRNSNLIKTIRYAAAANVSLLTDGSGNPLASVDTPALRTSASGQATLDRIVRAVYDAAGRVVYTVDEEGAVVETRYDGASRVTDTIAYANRVTIDRNVKQQLPADIVALLTPAATDRRTRSFYDADGNLRAVLDSAGFLVEYLYDDAGRLLRTIGYANATPVAERANGTLAALRPAADATNDVVSRFFYDGHGRRLAVLDSENYLSETIYDMAGNALQLIRYDVRPTNPAAATLDELRPAALGESQVTSYAYDAFGRIALETNHEGTVTEFRYDDVGNLLSTTRALATTDARTTRARYDGLGRVTAELTAQGSALITGTMTQAEIDAIWVQYGVRHTYDLAGHRTATTDQNGLTTLFFHDADGRLTHAVNALGEAVESRYDALGQLTETIAYTNRIDTNGLSGGLVNATLTSRVAAAADAARDARTTITYSLAGRVATTATAAGAAVAHTYSAFGDETARSEAIDATRNLQHEYTYDARGQRTLTRWDPSGLNTTRTDEYDAFGRLVRSTDANGNVRRAVYDRLGRVIDTYDGLDNRRRTSFDAFSRVLTTSDALDNVTSYDYDDVARSVRVTTPESVTLTTIRSRHGETVRIVDPRGNLTDFEYDLNGRLRRTIDSLGVAAEQTYDRAGRVLTMTDARGTVTAVAYDSANRVFTRTVDPGTGALALTTTYAYDGQGRAVDVTDALGVVTRTEYDRDGRAVTVTTDYGAAPRLNLRTEFQYNLRGDTVRVTQGAGSANPRVTEYGYDRLGRRTGEVVDPGAGRLNLTCTYEYDGVGNLARKIDPAGFATRYVYDAADRLRYTLDGLNGVTETIYDAEDRVTGTRRFATAINPATLPASGRVTVSQIEPLLQSSALDRLQLSVCDRDGREVYVVDAMGGVREKQYDAGGNVVREIYYSERIAAGTAPTVAAIQAALTAVNDGNTQNDRELRSLYDVRNRAIFQIDGTGGVVRNSYDGNGNVVARTEFAERRTQSGLPDVATLEAWVTANASIARDHTARSWFDAANRLVFATNGEGDIVEHRYDAVHRETDRIEYATRPTLPANATLAQVQAAVSTSPLTDQRTISAYDAAGRISSVTDAVGGVESYTYDAVGNRLTLTNLKQDTWNYVYDANRRLIEERSPQVAITTVSVVDNNLASSTATAEIVTRLTYDALGNLLTRTEAFGRPEARTTAYVYDALGRQVRTNFPAVGVYDAANDSVTRFGAAVVRQETTANLFTETTYNTLGDAIMNRDAAGNFSHKAYDALGRVQYEVDAERFVTEYRYDTFGNRSDVFRYASKLNDSGITVSTLLTSSIIAGRIVTNAADRRIQNEYDRVNRLITVIQPAVFNFLPASGTAGGTTATASPTTRYEYDAFGQVVRQRQLVDSAASTYADTYFYFDRRGYRLAQVDPVGHLTTCEYDAFGRMTRETEFARPLAAAWTTQSYGTPVTTTRVNMPDSTVGYDRVTVYDYDRLDRKTLESQLDVEFSQMSGNNPVRVTANRTTTFAYDAVGNQTQVTAPDGTVSYRFFDDLGRLIAIAEPPRNRGDGVNLTPLTEMRRDAFGNLVEQIQYANGATSASVTSYTPGAADTGPSGDRITRLQLDSHGHAIRTRDATGAQQFASYTSRGEIAKEWQPVTNNDGLLEMLVAIYEYDRLGQQTAVVEPQTLPSGQPGDTTPTLVVRNETRYNAFGEVSQKGINNGFQEYFDYDVAGRLWRTNGGDGVAKVFLYDLLGRTTAEIRSQQLNLKTGFTAPDGVHALTTQRMRTETRYDLLGRVVEQRLPAFTGDRPVRPISGTFQIGNLLASNNPDASYRRAQYLSEVGFVVHPAATVEQDGGYYFDGTNYVQDLNHQLVLGRYVYWPAPTGLGVDPTFEYRPAGNPSGAWTALDVRALPNLRIGVNVDELAAGTYEYRANHTRVGETGAFATASGTFTITGTTTTAPTLTPDQIDDAGWIAPLFNRADGDVFGYVVSSSELNDFGSQSTFYFGRNEVNVSFPQIAGPILLELEYWTQDASSDGFPMVKKTISRRINDASQSPGGISFVWEDVVGGPQAGGITSIESIRVHKLIDGFEWDLAYSSRADARSSLLTWQAPRDTSVVAEFRAQMAGDTSWLVLPVTRVGDEFKVDTAALGAGRWQYEVTYTRSGNVTARAAGSLELIGGKLRYWDDFIEATEDLRELAVPPISIGDEPPVDFQVVSFGSLNLVGNPLAFFQRTALQTQRSGTNSVAVTWPDLGTAPVRIVLDYTTDVRNGFMYDEETDSTPGWLLFTDRVDGMRASRTFEFAQAGTGATLSWQDPVNALDGGISQVDRLRVYTQNGSGEWVLQHDRNGAAPQPGRTLYWWGGNYHSEANVGVRVRLVGTSQWTTLSVVSSQAGPGSYYGRHIDIGGLADGEYEYEITNNRTFQGQPRVDGLATGILTIGGNPVGKNITLTATNLAFPAGRGDFDVSATGQRLLWTRAPNAGDSIVVRYRVFGEPVWQQQGVAGAGPSYFHDLNLGVPGTMPIEYEILYIASGQTQAYARSTGALMRENPSYILAPHAELTQTAVLTTTAMPIRGLSTQGDLISWTTPAEAGATIQFRYRVPAGTWSTLTVTTTATGYSVDPRTLAVGTYEYELTYTRSGESTPYALATGTMNLRTVTRGGSPTITRDAGGGSQFSTFAPSRSQVLDRWGNAIAVTDQLGNTANYRYNELNQITLVRQPETDVVETVGEVTTSRARPEIENHYDIVGRFFAGRDPNGIVNRVEYNAAGQVLRERHADGGIVDHRYDIFGNRTQTANELGFRTRSVYDRMSRLVQTQREVLSGAFESGAAGGLVTESFVYDEDGRRIRETNGENETLRYFYDLRGNVARRRSPRGFETRFRYDTQNKKLEEIDAINGVQTWTYDHFGRLTQHRDLLNAQYNYFYNQAGLQSTEGSDLGRFITFTYDEAGQLTRIVQDDEATSLGFDLYSTQRLTNYFYDAAGRRVSEETTVDGILHQDTRIDYDELGRIERLADMRYDTIYEYDAAGNRTHISATYLDHQHTGRVQDLWYTYDAMNRVLISQGELWGIANPIVRADLQRGTTLTYNLAGQRIQAELNEPGYVFGPIQIGIFIGGAPILRDGWSLQGNDSTEIYAYDGLGRLTSATKDTIVVDQRTYDAASRELTQTTRSYDWKGDETVRGRTAVYDDDGRASTQTTFVNGEIESVATYGDSTLVSGQWTRGYDAAGNLRRYTLDVYRGGGIQYTTTYRFNYRLGDTYQESAQFASSSGSNAPRSGSVFRRYNTSGELVSFNDTRDHAKNRYFANSAGGQPLTVVRGDYGVAESPRVLQAFSDATLRRDNQVKAQHFFFANGQAVGSFGQLQDDNGEFRANFDVNFTPVSERYPADVPSQVVTQQGDTLRIVAARIYGDGTLWYLIAEENGLAAPDEELEAGTVLIVPSEVVSLLNNATTFKAFDSTQAIGDATPTQPFPPPRKRGCGVLGRVLIIVVAIVVTVITAGAAASAFGSGAAAAGGGGLWATGTAALTGQLGVAGIAGAAVGGAVGSAASQGVAIATGMQDEFDWRSVGLSAVGAGVGAGLGQAGVGASAARALGLGQFSSVGIAINAAAGSLLTQGIAVATGLQSSFNWREVVISAVSAPIAAAVGGPPDTQSFASRFASGAAGSLVRMALGGKVDSRNIIADAFGNALGQAFIDTMTGEAVYTPPDSDDLSEIVVTARRMPEASGERTVSVNPTQSSAPAEPETHDERHAIATATEASAEAQRHETLSANVMSAVAESVASPELIGQLVVTGRRFPSDLTRQDLYDTLLLIQSTQRRGLSKEVKYFDADAIKHAMGPYGGGNDAIFFGRPRTTAEFAPQEALRRSLEGADSANPGDAQLVALFPDSMSPSARLEEAIRASGGYFTEAVGENLLMQINSGAEAIDLTYARAQSEQFLQMRIEDLGLWEQAAMASAASTHDSSIESQLQWRVASLIGSDSLLPTIDLPSNQPGVMRETWRAVNMATLAGGAVDLLAAGPLAFARIGAARGIPRVTEKGLARVEAHLDDVLRNQYAGFSRADQLMVQAGERGMLARLRSGATASQDIEFYLHELKESARFRVTGDLIESHNAALRWRGVTSQHLFHQEVIRAHPELFSPIWRQ